MILGDDPLGDAQVEAYLLRMPHFNLFETLLKLSRMRAGFEHFQDLEAVVMTSIIQILTLEPRQHVPCNSVYAGVLLCEDASTTCTCLSF
jgi:hypothetical protein